MSSQIRKPVSSQVKGDSARSPPNSAQLLPPAFSICDSCGSSCWHQFQRLLWQLRFSHCSARNDGRASGNVGVEKHRKTMSRLIFRHRTEFTVQCVCIVLKAEQSHDIVLYHPLAGSNSSPAKIIAGNTDRNSISRSPPKNSNIFTQTSNILICVCPSLSTRSSRRANAAQTPPWPSPQASVRALAVDLVDLVARQGREEDLT